MKKGPTNLGMGNPPPPPPFRAMPERKRAFPYDVFPYQDCLLCTLYKVTNMDPSKKSYSAGFDIDLYTFLYTLLALTSFGRSTGIVQVSK